MENKNKLRLECLSEFPNYGKVAFAVNIIDGSTVTIFSDRRLARDTYLLEKKMGNTNIEYKERLGCLVEKYPGITKEDIVKMLVKKFEEHNVKFKEKK